MKNIELTPTQIKALENGATLLILPLKYQPFFVNYKDYGWCCDTKDTKVLRDGTLIYGYKKNELLKRLMYESFLKYDDKDVWVKEKFRILNDYENNKTLIQYKSEKYEDKYYKWQPASQMTKKQSRYSIDCLDVKIVKVQDLSLEEIERYVGKNSFIICDEFEQFRFNLRKLKEYYNTQLEEANINRTYENNDYVFLVEVKFNNYSKNF